MWAAAAADTRRAAGITPKIVSLRRASQHVFAFLKRARAFDGKPSIGIGDLVPWT